MDMPHFLTIYKLMDIWVAQKHKFLCEYIISKSLKYIPSRGIAGSFGNSMFNLLRNCKTVFNSSWTIFYSQQQDMNVLIYPHPCYSLLLS